MALTQFRVALLQLSVSEDKAKNLENAENFIKNAKKGGAKLIILPECFNSPYGNEFFSKYAENVPNGPTCAMLSKAAKENSVYIVGGTIPEIENGKMFNTATIWDPNGQFVGKYRKVHLYDIGITGTASDDRIVFNESGALTPGEEMCLFDFYGIKMGVIICHDMRFEEWIKLYRIKGVEVLINPCAFDMVTGKIHYNIIQQARALDNLMYLLTAAPATGDKGYIAWGHSTVVNPNGKIIAQAGHLEEILYCEINLEEVVKARREIPIFEQRKTHVYSKFYK